MELNEEWKKYYRRREWQRRLKAWVSKRLGSTRSTNAVGRSKALSSKTP